MPAFIDFIGLAFGNLTVIKLESTKNATMWLCRCSCGTEISVRQARLRSGAATSCVPCRPPRPPRIRPPVVITTPTRTHKRGDYFDESDSMDGSGIGGNPLMRLRNRPSVALAKSIIAELESCHIPIPRHGMIDPIYCQLLAPITLATLANAGLLAHQP